MSPPRKLRCTVAAIADHGDRVYTLDLATATPAPAFHPGQFLHLTAEAYDPASFWPESRVFSIASPPRERNRLRICYSVKGRYTTRMEKTLKVGSAAWIKLPYGDFVIDGASDAVLIAGGTGISAFTAFLEALPPAHPRRVTLLYGARTPALWLFRDMIERQLAACPSFSALFFAESGLSADVCQHPSDCRPLIADRCPPSSVLRPPSSIFSRPSSDSRPLPTDRRPLTADRCLPSSDCRPLTADSCPLSSVGPSSAEQSSVLCPSSSESPSSVCYLPGRISLDAVLGPLPSDSRPLPTDRRPLTADRCLPSSDCRPLTADRCLPSSVLSPPSSDFRPPSSVSPSSIFYLSGPPVMLKSLSSDLRACGITEENIRTDAWE
jgi:ferredoxin-NADP reductase